jgi:hypothetical protein
MSDRDTYRDTLFYALAIVASEQELAEQLRTTVLQVKNWLDGVYAIPERIFQAALDVAIGSSRQAIGRSRGMLDRLAR